MLRDVIRCTGSIRSELGKLGALQELWVSDNELTGESNMCLGVLAAFVVSNGAHVSNRIFCMEDNRVQNPCDKTALIYAV